MSTENDAPAKTGQKKPHGLKGRPTNNPHGRPRTRVVRKGAAKPAGKGPTIDEEQLKQLLMMQCTDVEISRVLGVSEDVLQRIKREDPEFAALWHKARAEGSASVRRFLFQQAQDGSTAAAIWLSKQPWCGMREPVQEHEIRERTDAVTDGLLAAVRRNVTDEEYERILDDLERGGDAGASGEESAARAPRH